MELFRLESGLLEPFWSDPGDVGGALAPQTFAVSLPKLSDRVHGPWSSDSGLCTWLLLGSDAMDRGLHRPTVRGFWSGSGMYPEIGSTDHDLVLWQLDAAWVWGCRSLSGRSRGTWGMLALGLLPWLAT